MTFSVYINVNSKLLMKHKKHYPFSSDENKGEETCAGINAGMSC